MALGARAGITNLATGAVDPLGAANSFRPLEVVLPARPDAGAPAIEYRMMWPEQGEPPEALSRVRAEVWAAWARGTSLEDRPPGGPGEAWAAMRRAAESASRPGSESRRVEGIARLGAVLTVTVRRHFAPPANAAMEEVEHLMFRQADGHRVRLEDLVAASNRVAFAARVAAASGRTAIAFEDLKNFGVFPGELRFAILSGAQEVRVPLPAVADLVEPAWLEALRE